MAVEEGGVVVVDHRYFLPTKFLSRNHLLEHKLASTTQYLFQPLLPSNPEPEFLNRYPFSDVSLSYIGFSFSVFLAHMHVYLAAAGDTYAREVGCLINEWVFRVNRPPLPLPFFSGRRRLLWAHGASVLHGLWRSVVGWWMVMVEEGEVDS